MQLLNVNIHIKVIILLLVQCVVFTLTVYVIRIQLRQFSIERFHTTLNTEALELLLHDKRVHDKQVHDKRVHDIQTIASFKFSELMHNQ